MNSVKRKYDIQNMIYLAEVHCMDVVEYTV